MFLILYRETRHDHYWWSGFSVAGIEPSKSILFFVILLSHLHGPKSLCANVIIKQSTEMGMRARALTHRSPTPEPRSQQLTVPVLLTTTPRRFHYRTQYYFIYFKQPMKIIIISLIDHTGTATTIISSEFILIIGFTFLQIYHSVYF